MTRFDREIKRLIRDVKPPETYEKKVDDILQSIEKQEKASVQKRRNPKWVLRAALCLVCIVCLISISTIDVHANIFETFKASIMDFLGLTSEEAAEQAGVENEKINNVSKPDLMMETREVVVDSHMIYLLVEIKASSSIEFAKDVGFDYFCFCAGDNYNTENLLTGARSCELLEVNGDKPNVATYIVSIAFDQELEEGSNVTAYFKDLERNPYSDKPELLIEGMWSVTFPVNKTVTEQVLIEGNADMVFSYQNTTATVDYIEITPLGLVLNADVSKFPYEQLGLSDTTIAIKLKMIDNSELVIVSHLPGEGFVECASTCYEQDGNKSYQQDTMEFTEVISLEKVCGIYIEDLYIPFEQ